MLIEFNILRIIVSLILIFKSFISAFIGALVANSSAFLHISMPLFSRRLNATHLMAQLFSGNSIERNRGQLRGR